MLTEDVLHSKLIEAARITNCYNTGWGRVDFCKVNKIPELFARKLSSDPTYKAYLSPDLPGKICFKKKESSVANTTLARFVRRHLKIGLEEVPDQVLEGFNNCFNLIFKSEEDLIKEVRILRGGALLSFYKKTLISTCMTGEANSHRITFFANNPEKVGVIVVGEDNARALIWLADNGISYIDNPYGHTMPNVIMKKWADVNKHKFMYTGHIRCEDFVVSNLRTVPHFPSMDTIRYGRMSEDKTTVDVCHLGELIKPNIRFSANAPNGYNTCTNSDSYY